MKTTSIIAKSLLAAALGMVLLSPKAEATATDQVAIQLGAIQLGIDLTSNSTTDLQRAQALAQGRAVLRSTVKKAQVGVAPISASEIQTEALRSQILEATKRALSSPVTATFTQTVTLTNNKTTSVRASLDPKKVTASSIFDLATKRIPNFSPGLIVDGIEGALAQSGGSFVFNYKDEGSMLKDVNKLAANAMKAGLKAYARGTVNWAGVPSSGVGNGTFLPNFSSKPIQPKSSSPQAPDLAGLANAAGAIAAAAAETLDNSTLSSPSVKTAAMTNLATSLVKGAASFQRTSTTTGLNALVGGAVAGSGFGQVVMLADTNGGSNDMWNNQTNLAIMNGIIAGGVKGSKSNAYAFAWGVASGFVAAYYESGGTTDINTFKTNNINAILTQFTDNGVKTSGKFDSGSGVAPVTLETVLSEAMDAAYDAFVANDYSTIAGGLGVSLPGTPTPVTDTVGL
ncbi:MAG: hypothetical protein Fur0032_24490 [Terrimicrobiaceae bacterium]